MRKNILRFLAFWGIFVILFCLLTPVFSPKNNTGEAGIHDPDANGILGEPENSIDVLFVGDSVSYYGIMPLKIWEEQGISSFTMAALAQRSYVSLERMRTAFQNQRPKVVMLEVTTLFWEFGKFDVVPEQLETRLPLLRYHDRWKQLGWEDFTDPVRYTAVTRDKGYRYTTQTVPVKPGDYREPTEEFAPMMSINKSYLIRCRELCREYGAQLTLVSIPSTFSWSMQRHNTISALSRELEIPYLDMNMLPEEAVGIDWQRDFYDSGDHMNYRGAGKTSSYLGKYLAETGLFTDKREDPAYDAWNQALEEFRAILPEQ